MSPAASFHSQLASIMEVLANTAVAEICELVDSGYAVLQLEVSRSRRENEVLRRKLRLMELKAARGAALRAVVNNSSSGSRVEQRRTGTPTVGVMLSRSSNQDPVRRSIPGSLSNPGPVRSQETPAAVETSAVIKVEEMDDNSWSQPETHKDFIPVSDGRIETYDLSSPVKQEVEDTSGAASQSWTTGEVSSTSTYVQKKQQSSNHRPETSSYERLVFEPPAQTHYHTTTQNALDLDPGCSSVLNNSNNVSDSGSSSSSSFSFSVSETRLQPTGVSVHQQRAPTSLDESVTLKESERKSFACNYCGKKLACLKNLTTHMRVHTGEKPFVCMLCGKRFSDSSNLKRHQSVHTGEKRYSCVHCGKRFAQSGSLKVHMTVHTDCKQFRCSLCNKMFISHSHLRRHLTTHAAEEQTSNAAQ
ncbi:transcription factor che-1-like [Gouania willdenowi]|uniref:transcription factor che-1-like n=1 Tax=Gouania willdenowi TaxID=441366 RepID=UPI001054A89C|nr:transcription factor che-1-like [Gouania willdenowi]